MAGGGGGRKLTIRVLSEEQQELHKSSAWAIRGKNPNFQTLVRTEERD